MIALAGLSLVGAACSSSGTSASRGQFRSAANAVCAAADAQAAKVPSPPDADGPSIATTVSAVVGIERDALRRLEQIIRPPADAPVIVKWFGDVRRTIDATAAVGTASARGDFAAAATARDKGNAYAATADQFARDFGLAECATPAEATDTGAASTSTTTGAVDPKATTTTTPGTND
ncbi:MAG: hypothetical protein JWL73_2766 [Actinomycetia bacterium]|nr:hypothetical protein [Actinomycetes bacterium]